MSRAALIRHYYYRGGQGYSEAVQAYVDKLTALGYTQPDAGFLSALNTLLATPLETGTVYSRMKTGNIYGFGSIEAGTVNLKDPDSYQHTLVNSPTYLAGNGVKSNGTNSYINTQYAVNEYAGIETDLTTVVYVSESSTSALGTTVVGSRSVSSALTTQYVIRPHSVSGFGQKLGYAAIDAFTNDNHKGLYVMTYDGSNSVIYKDGTKDSQAVTPTAPDIANKVFFLARNGNSAGGTTPGEYYTLYSALLFRFDRFSDTDESRWRAGFNNFKSAVSLT